MKDGELIHHLSKQEAVEFFIETFEKATDESSKFFGLLFWIDKDSQIQMRRTAWDFPVDDFETLKRKLAETLDGEKRARRIDTSPLPEAKLDIPKE